MLRPGWTLNYEMYFYACILLFVFLNREYSIFLTCVALVFNFFVFNKIHYDSVFSRFFFSSVVLEFVFGCFSFYCLNRFRAKFLFQFVFLSIFLFLW